jgi:hypothetical protein
LADNVPVNLTRANGRCTLKAAVEAALGRTATWVGSVSSPMQEAAVRLLDAVTVSNLPHC